MVGGLEKLSYALAKEFSEQTNTTLITWGKSQKYLPFFIFVAFIKALYLIPTKKIDHIHIGDGLLSPLGLLLKKMFGIKTSITIAGLDITFDFPGYQLIVPSCVSQLDKIICISESTRKECLKRSIPKEKCFVIPCGVYPEDWEINATRNDLEKIVKDTISNKKILITVGRLVERKGVYWFIKNVLPELSRDTLYLVIGDGEEKDRIKELIEKLHLEKRVLLLGKISDDELKIIYNTADLFVMPNIKVNNNIEGFGIVAIEASSAGLPVIASDMEGISSAVIDKKTGRLVKSMDAKRFVEVIGDTNNFHKKLVAQTTKENYSWKAIGMKYMNIL
jgi:glycosyltransferase involved in cell wall biosynthesis